MTEKIHFDTGMNFLSYKNCYRELYNNSQIMLNNKANKLINTLNEGNYKSLRLFKLIKSSVFSSFYIP